MNSASNNQTLLTENQYQWQEIANTLDAQQRQVDDIEKIQRLAIASNYALHQMHRSPELIDRLLESNNFTLNLEIISLEANQKVDLDQIKQQLRQYRHQKLVEIVFLDVVTSNPL